MTKPTCWSYKDTEISYVQHTLECDNTPKFGHEQLLGIFFRRLGSKAGAPEGAPEEVPEEV